MDLSELPVELIRYISAFVYTGSWRDELHFKILWEYYRTRNFENVPRCLVEMEDAYIYENGNQSVRILKRDTLRILDMKYIHVVKYCNPLKNYLSDFRNRKVEKEWRPLYSFRRFGIHIPGDMDPMTYRIHLKMQGQLEMGSENWQGCLPLEPFRNACILSMPSIWRDTT